jgi:F0F1-type ATP synthase assembly protein I
MIFYIMIAFIYGEILKTLSSLIIFFLYFKLLSRIIKMKPILEWSNYNCMYY